MVAVSDTCVSIGRRVMYVFNLGIPVFLAYTGAMGLSALTEYNQDATATVFQCIYMLMFAALLFLYEAIQICPCGPVDNVMKRNFGFFYGVYGKAFYTMMIGIFAYGLTTPRQLSIACAVIVAAYGPFCVLLHLLLPSFFEKKEKYVP